jgi:hypothetical protein
MSRLRADARWRWKVGCDAGEDVQYSGKIVIASDVGDAKKVSTCRSLVLDGNDKVSSLMNHVQVLEYRQENIL